MPLWHNCATPGNTGFHFEKSSQVVGYKQDVTEEDFLFMPVTLPSQELLPKKYATRLPISVAKKRDLTNLIKSGVIPDEYSSFYHSLPNSKTTRDVAVWESTYNADDDYDDIEVEEIDVEAMEDNDVDQGALSILDKTDAAKKSRSRKALNL